MPRNLVAHVEIPVADLDRAIRFYEAAFAQDLQRHVADGYEMALFPFEPGAPGAAAALVKGDVYLPAKSGPIIYIGVDDLDAVIARACAHGAVTLYDKKDVGEWGWVAEIEDSEGNRIALHQGRGSD
jgi:predicted enzyme related to lactoylglutathione lyase